MEQITIKDDPEDFRPTINKVNPDFPKSNQPKGDLDSPIINTFKVDCGKHTLPTTNTFYPDLGKQNFPK